MTLTIDVSSLEQIENAIDILEFTKLKLNKKLCASTRNLGSYRTATEQEEIAAKKTTKSKHASKEKTDGTESVISKEQLTEKLSKKVKGNRSVIYNKLQEYKAESISTLDKKHYSSFYDFLETL